MTAPDSPTARQQPPTGGKVRRTEKTPIFLFLAAIIIPIVSMIAKFRIIDGHKMPRHGAIVVSPNHYSEIDPVIIGVVMWKLKRMPRFLAKASVFKNPVLGAILRAAGQIPVERSGRGSNSLKAAATHAEKGLAVVIYPEGTLTRDPDLWPMRGKTGAVRMALEAGVPLIPIAHWGTQKIMPRYGKRISLFPRKRIDVKVGDPVNLDDLRGVPMTSDVLSTATERLMVAITELLEDLRGETAPDERWDPSKKNQSETGRF